MCQEVGKQGYCNKHCESTIVMHRKKQVDDLVWWSSGQVEASEPVTRDVEAPSFPPAAHAPAPDAPPLTALPHSSRLRTMAAAHDQKPAQKPSRVGALLELAESCPPLKEVLPPVFFLFSK